MSLTSGYACVGGCITYDKMETDDLIGDRQC